MKAAPILAALLSSLLPTFGFNGNQIAIITPDQMTTQRPDFRSGNQKAVLGPNLGSSGNQIVLITPENSGNGNQDAKVIQNRSAKGSGIQLPSKGSFGVKDRHSANSHFGGEGKRIAKKDKSKKGVRATHQIQNKKMIFGTQGPAEINEDQLSLL